jgi:hypothetical protein
MWSLLNPVSLCNGYTHTAWVAAKLLFLLILDRKALTMQIVLPHVALVAPVVAARDGRRRPGVGNNPVMLFTGVDLG